MATATITRPATTVSAPTARSGVTPQATAGQKAVTAVVIGAASAATIGVFAWAAWVASQIAIPV